MTAFLRRNDVVRPGLQDECPVRRRSGSADHPGARQLGELRAADAGEIMDPQRLRQFPVLLDP